MLWGLNYYPDAAPTSPTTTVGWIHPTPHGHLRHELSLDVGGTESVPVEALQTEFLYRMLCYKLVDVLPREALREAVEDIADIFRLYLPRPGQAKKLPPAIPRLQGTLASPRPRKPLHFSTEE
jgi:hypothetical protein